MSILSKKLLEAGLISPQIAGMLEKWGYLNEPNTSLDGKKLYIGSRHYTEDDLTDLADEIESLIEDNRVKETKLEIHVKKPPIQFWDRNFIQHWAVEDEMGRLVVSPTTKLIRGEKIIKSLDPAHMEWACILEVDQLYENDKVCALLVTLDR